MHAILNLKSSFQAQSWAQDSGGVMGLLGSLATSVKTAAQRSAAGGDVSVQVRAQYDEMMEDIKEKVLDVPEAYAKRLVPVFAASQVEAQMLACADMLIEQLQHDGRRAMPVEVRTKVIETARDIKMTALEADGCVNPFDLTAIRLAATALKAKARTYLMSARMGGATDIGETLDIVELRLLGDVTKLHGHDYAKWQRAAQSAIWALAELRLQQLVG